MVVREGGRGFFKVFSLPDTSDPSTNPLTQTHFGSCQFAFTEPVLVSTRPTATGLHTIINLLAIINGFEPTVQPIQLILNTDSTITITALELPAALKAAGNPFNLHITPSGTGRARVVTMSDHIGSVLHLAAYDIRYNNDDTVDGQLRLLDVGEDARGIYDIAFDGVRGCLCVTFSGQRVAILDYA